MTTIRTVTLHCDNKGCQGELPINANVAVSVTAQIRNAGWTRVRDTEHGLFGYGWLDYCPLHKGRK